MASQRGFTLIELMVTVTVAAILISVAIPFFRDIIISSRLNTISLEIADALALARSESIKRNRTITFCRTDSAGSTDNTNSHQCNSGTEWAHWLIREGASGTDEDGMIKRGSFDSLSSITVKTSGINNGQLNFSTDGLIRSSGSLISNAQFIINTQNSKRIICIGAAGQVSIKPNDGACK